MNTIKTSIVVVLLLAVLYGVYVVLNEPDPQPPPEVAWQEGDATAALQIDLGEPAKPGELTHPLLENPPAADSASPAVEVQPSRSVASPYSPPDSASTPPDSPTGSGSSPSKDAAGKGAAGPSADASPSSTLGAPEPLAPSDPSSRSAAAPVRSTAGAASVYQPPAEAGGGEPGREESPSQPPRPAEAPAAAKRPAGRKNDAAQHLVARAFQKALGTAQSQIEKGQYYDALFTLSIFYNSPDLSQQERQKLLDLLDPLAGKVIYSREHCLQSPYKVGADETLMDIARRYHVPWQLLQHINGIRDPKVLVPGAELKVVRGPFRAEVDLARGELTVFLGRLYAGRFPISLGRDPSPRPGEYQVVDKRLNHPYYASDGRTIPAEDPRNPYGRVWIDLGGDVCIHGSPPSVAAADSRLGCISLSPIDADDVYAILSQGSKVAIRR